MPITNKEDWDVWVEKNDDPYGKACVDVAREVMNILDKEEDFDPHQIICDADDNIKAGGITGFMAGCVSQMVSRCHSRGEEFRKAWNKDVGGVTGQEDSEGVLNPALLNIGVPK
jgi:hypothetical protein